MKFATTAVIFASLANASPVSSIALTTTYYTTIWVDCESSSAVPPAVVSASAFPINATQPEPTTTVTTTLYHTVSEKPAATFLELATGTDTQSGLTAQMGNIYSGKATWKEVGFGACGWTNTDDEHIVAIGKSLFNQFVGTVIPNSQLCGKKIRVYFENKSLDLGVVSSCENCGPYDLQLSPSAFSEITGSLDKEISVDWEWI